MGVRRASYRVREGEALIRPRHGACHREPHPTQLARVAAQANVRALAGNRRSRLNYRRITNEPGNGEACPPPLSER